MAEPMDGLEARRAADIEDAFHALDLAHIQGVLVLSSPLFGGNPQLVAGIAVRKKSADHFALTGYRQRGRAARLRA